MKEPSQVMHPAELTCRQFLITQELATGFNTKGGLQYLHTPPS